MTTTKSNADKLNDIWRSGYCEETVEAGRFYAREPAKRVEWLRAHLPNCPACEYANTMKGVEARVAEKIGLLDKFNRGEDVHRSPGFKEGLQQEMEDLLKGDDINPEFIVWWGGVALRQDYEKEKKGASGDAN
jgi:hypothetical protein